MLNSSHKILNAVLLGSLMALPMVSSSDPQISVSGALEDSSSGPVSGNFDFRIAFYTSETVKQGTRPLHPSLDIEADLQLVPASDTVDSITVEDEPIEDGVFSVFIDPPADIQELDRVWYSLEIDRDDNGFDAADLFPNLFPVAAVPFTIGVPPQRYYVTGGGESERHSSTYGGMQTVLFLNQFQAPEGGVIFDRAAIRMEYGGTWGSSVPDTRASFGIYDMDGNSVAVSPRIVVNTSGYFEMEFKGRLKPRGFYYVGVGRNFSLYTLEMATSPLMGAGGRIWAPVVEGMIPDSFDPAQLDRRSLNNDGPNQSASVILFDSSKDFPHLDLARTRADWFTVNAEGETSYNGMSRQSKDVKTSDWWTPEEQILNSK